MSSLWHAHYKKGSKRFATEEVLAQIFDGNSDVEEEISESEDLSETEDNAIDDPDWEFSYEEDSEDQSGVVSTLAENNGQQSSSTEGTWTAKDGNIKWSDCHQNDSKPHKPFCHTTWWNSIIISSLHIPTNREDHTGHDQLVGEQGRV